MSVLFNTVKKPYGYGDKGPPEPLSPAGQRDEPLTAAAPQFLSVVQLPQQTTA